MKARLGLLTMLLVLFAVPSAFGFVQDVPGDGCGSIDPNQPCYAGGTYTYCTKPEGCPQCGQDFNTGATVCFVLDGQAYGYCTCKPAGRRLTKAGYYVPNCTTSGSCRARR